MSIEKKRLERLGMAYVAECLYAENIFFAQPDIDAGIDFIAYRHRPSLAFSAVPVQLKAFSDEEFLTDRKYLEIDGLYIVYLWHVGTDTPIRAFGMPYPDAEKIVDEQGWSRDAKGRYARTSRSDSLRNALAPKETVSWTSLFWE